MGRLDETQRQVEQLERDPLLSHKFLNGKLVLWRGDSPETSVRVGTEVHSLRSWCIGRNATTPRRHSTRKPELTLA